VDKVENGKIIVIENNILKELDPTDIADRMMRNRYPEGGPIRIVSLTPSNTKDTKALADFLAMKFNTKAKTHIEDIKINEDGVLRSKTIGETLEAKGTNVHWEEIDYGKLPEPEGMIRGPQFVKDEKANRVFTLMPHKIMPDGSIMCRVDGKLVTYTPDEIATLLEKNGLRADERIQIGLPKNEFYESNAENLAAFTERLGKKVDNKIQYPDPKEKIYIVKETNQYEKVGLENQMPRTEKLDAHIIEVGEKKSLVLLTEGNYKIAEKDNLYVVVEGFTGNGKVRVYRPQRQKIDELTPDEFLKEIQTAYGQQYAAVKNKPIRIVSKTGIGDDAQLQKFIEDVAEKSKVKVETTRDAVDLPNGATIPVKGLKWIPYTPMGEGRYFLTKNITNRKIWENLNHYDNEFLEKLGKALSENNGKHVSLLTKDPENSGFLIRNIYEDYTAYGKEISLPTFVNLQSIAKKLNILSKNSLWEKAYKNPLFAKILDSQLKHLEPSDLKELIDDPDLLTRAIHYVEYITMHHGPGLQHFMASVHLRNKLPADLANNIILKVYGKNEPFVAFLGHGVENLSEKELGQLERLCLHYDPENFLKGLESEYKAQTLGSKLDLSGYISRMLKKDEEVVQIRSFSDNTMTISILDEPQKIVSNALPLMDQPADLVVEQALSRLKEEAGNIAQFVTHTDQSGKMFFRKCGDKCEWIEPKDAAKHIGRVLDQRGVDLLSDQMALARIVTCTPSPKEVQEIVENLPSRVQIEVPGSPSGNVGSPAGVAENGDIVNLNKNEKLHWVIYEKGKVPVFGKIIREAVSGDNAVPLGWSKKSAPNPNQLVFADAGDLKKLAHELPPKQGYFDFFSEVNEEGFNYRFKIDLTTQKFDPDQVADILRKMPGYKKNMPLRFILDGNEEALKLNGPVQKLINRMNVVAEVYHLPTSRKMYPTMAVLGEDATSILHSRLIRQVENQIDVLVHGYNGGKGLAKKSADGSSVVIPIDEFVDWLLKEPAFAEAIRDGKTFTMRLFSCCASKENVASDISAALAKRGVNIDLIAPNVSVWIDNTGKILGDSKEGGDWLKYAKGKLVGKVGDRIPFQ
jgi:hypothetical protein